MLVSEEDRTGWPAVTKSFPEDGHHWQKLSTRKDACASLVDVFLDAKIPQSVPRLLNWGDALKAIYLGRRKRGESRRVGRKAGK